MEELIYYSNKYSTVKTIESAKEKFRNILDRSIFSRTEAQQRQIEGLFRDRNLRKRSSDDSFLHTVHYNILYNWKNGSENDWEKEYRFTRKNYNLLLTNPEKIKYFPELSIQLFYNYLIAVSISGRAWHNQALKKFSELILQLKSKRFKQDGFFYLNLSKLIHLNRNKTSQIGPKVISEAQRFIEQNKDGFSVLRLNNFYFDLAKAYFYLND